MDEEDLECIVAAILASGMGSTATFAGAVNRYRRVLEQLRNTGGATRAGDEPDEHS